MTTLARRTTTGDLSYDKYVRDNPNFKETIFEIEKGMTSELFQYKRGSMVPGLTYPSGTQFLIKKVDLIEADSYRFTYVELMNGLTGWFPISRIRKPTGINSNVHEEKVVDILNEFMFRIGKPLKFNIGGDVYSNITYAMKVTKELKDQVGLKVDPKADIILCRDRTNPLGTGSIYISHKRDGGAKAFQQYGGLSPLAGEGINLHPESQKFMKNVVKFMKTGELKQPILSEIKCPDLINLSIFGPEYASGKFSLQHTQMIGQGLPNIEYNKRGVFNLNFTEHTSTSGDVKKFSGDYQPVFSATKRNGRGFEYKNIKYNGVRLGVFPMKVALQRRDVKIV